WPRHDLSACFTFGKVTPEPDFVAHVKSLIASTWQRSTHLNIVWDDDCDEQPHDLVLRLSQIDDTHAELGFPGAGASLEVVLLFTRGRDGEILHAVGRALGFGYEYGKPVARELCTPCTSSDDCQDLPGTNCRPSGYCGDDRGVLSVMAAPDCGGVIE